jgi:hypothetical protein
MPTIYVALLLAAGIIGLLAFGIVNILLADRLIEIANRGLSKEQRFDISDGLYDYTFRYRLWKRLFQVWREQRKSN